MQNISNNIRLVYNDVYHNDSFSVTCRVIHLSSVSVTVRKSQMMTRICSLFSLLHYGSWPSTVWLNCRNMAAVVTRHHQCQQVFPQSRNTKLQHIKCQSVIDEMLCDLTVAQSGKLWHRVTHLVTCGSGLIRAKWGHMKILHEN